VSAKKAFVISLVRPARVKAKTIHSFRPAFAYSIFGDDERIFGYEGLEIDLSFHASDMRPNLQISWRKQFEATGETEAADVGEILKEYLPAPAFQSKKIFDEAIRNTRADWTPPGALAATFARDDVTYEVWKGSLTDPAVKQLVKRIQIFVPLFIEGGTYIPTDEADDDRWTLFFLYQKKPIPGDDDRASYVFNGYSTVYRFFRYIPPTPPSSPSQYLTSALDQLDIHKEFDLSVLPCRSRISQFIILPPFQGKGLGPKLYNTIFQEYLRHPQTVEITVEDPNEVFDDMRDIADLHFLRQRDDFNALHIDTSIVIPNKDGVAPSNIVDREAAEAVRQRTKIAPRQFARVLEMHLMSKLPDSVRPGIEPEGPVSRPTKDDKHVYRLWQLMVKQRVYRLNKDALGELEIPERITKLNETVDSVAFDFARLLIKAERYEEGANGKGKRKAEEEGEGAASKKQKV